MKWGFLIIFIFSGFSLFAQQIQEEQNDSIRTQNLEEIIVTATRTERQLSSLPLPAQIVTKKEIENVSSIRLNDILNEQTGLVTVPDFGGGEGIQLQGLDAQYTLILIDEMPLIGRSAGTLDISRISVGNIKQIEVVKGASSSLYGSDALGGVINIITTKPKDGLQGNVYYRYGTFNTHDGSISLNYKRKKVGIGTFINRNSSSGYDLIKADTLNTNTVEPFENYTFNTKLTYQFSKKTDLLLSGRYYFQTQDNIAIVNEERLKGDSKLNEWNAHAKLSHIFDDKWSSYIELYTTQYRAKESLKDMEGNNPSESNFNQLFLRPELRTTFSPNLNHTFTGGVGWNHEALDRTDFSTRPVFNSQYVFIQYDSYLTSKLNLIAGLRFDNHSEYKSQLSPKLAVRYELNNKIAFRGSVGYGFKAPDFRQLYLDFSNATVGYAVLGYNVAPGRLAALDDLGQISNIIVPFSDFESALKPESSVSLNVGLQYEPTNNVSFDINFFRNNIRDMIDTRVIASRTNGQNVFSYYNVNQAYTQGVELNTTWTPIKQLKISGGYQLLFAKDMEAKKAFERGEVFARDSITLQSFPLNKHDYFGLLNRSRHMGNIKVFYTIPKWNLTTNIRGIYRSRYGIIDTNDNAYLDNFDDFVKGYFIWDWAINKKIYEHFELGLGVDNIFGFTDPQNISNIPGRLLYGKINIHF